MIGDISGIDRLPVVRCYKDSILLTETRVVDDPRWQVHLEVTFPDDYPDATDISGTFELLSGVVSGCALGLKFDFPYWSVDNYVCMPAAVYAGNRFEARAMSYPPLFRDPADWRIDIPTVITDVPRLSVGAGKSRVQLLTRDLATPAFGAFFPDEKQGLWIFIDQGTRLGDSGFDLQESDDRESATLTLLAPGMREAERYSGLDFSSLSDDKGADFRAGDVLQFGCRISRFECADIPALFDRYVALRKGLVVNEARKHELPFSAAWDILEEKYNRDNWDEKHRFYRVGIGEGVNNVWQLGWIGGGMVTSSLLLEGSEISKQRALRNLDFMLTESVAPSGLLYGASDGEHFYSDATNVTHPDNLHLIRKNSDALYFIVKQLFLLDEIGRGDDIRPAWIEATRNLAEAFVRLWMRSGQFGQFVDITTGEITVGGSTSASTAPAGLALASEYFHEPRYLDVAAGSAELFHSRDICAGVTTGGPGDALQCPDSESAFGLLESFITLYEVTGDRVWVERARDAANQCASWCVSYDYKFPPDSLFGRFDMRTTGSVWANVQNKHSAPGIATLSGDSLFKLYRASGDISYLDLLRDIAHGITQYLSRADKPIENMPPGWMNERVNMSDWENCIGGIFYGSCWPEVSCMLTFSEVPGVYVQRDTGMVWVFDNVDASEVRNTEQGLELTLANPTKFEARVKLFVEESADTNAPIGHSVMLGCRRIAIAPRSSVSVIL